jgi:hypothetical protein
VHNDNEHWIEIWIIIAAIAHMQCMSSKKFEHIACVLFLLGI